MNARSDVLPLATAPIGVGTYLRGAVTTSIVIPANMATLLLFNPGGGATVARAYTKDGQALSPAVDYTLGSLVYDPAPEDFSVRRGTLELTDITQVLNRGGSVRVWNTSQSAIADLDLNTWTSLVNTMVADPHTRVFGTELSTTHAWDSNIVSYGRYESFRDYAATSFPIIVDDPAMSNILVYFEPYGNARTFMLGVCAGAYCRYAAGSVLSRMAKPIGVIPLPAAVAANSAACRLGSAPSRVGNGPGGRGPRPSARPGRARMGGSMGWV